MQQHNMQDFNTVELPAEQPPEKCQLPDQCPPLSEFGQPQGQPQPYQLPPYEPPLGKQPCAQQEQPYSQQQFAEEAALTDVVTSEPENGVVPYHPQIVPDNHAAIAWFTSLCCCLPLGIAAIIKSGEVDNAVRNGDLLTAKQASQSARRYSYLGILFGFVSSFILIILYLHRDGFY